MEVFDENGSLLACYDPELGWLEAATRTVHHEAVAAVAEEGHWETLREYENGGKDIGWVVDVPGAEGREAWDEEVGILVYHPYTAEELAARGAERDKPSVEQRVAELEDALVELAAMIAAERSDLT